MTQDAEEIRRRMPAIVAGEVAAINRTFAGTRPGRNPPAKVSQSGAIVAGRSYVSYPLRLDPTVMPQDVAKMITLLTETLYRLRNGRGNTNHPVTVRLRYKPLALEVNHPFPAPLDWQRAQTALQPDTMLTGRNYSGGEPCDDTLSFDDTPHVLIVGTTGSGKSTMLRMMIATLALNTSPDALRMYLVDLKNEDLLPFRRLPHVETTAITRAQAMDVVRYMHAEKNRRVVEGKTTGPRCVLVVDELAQIADKSTVQLLDDTLAVARSKRINAIFATQKPTVDVVGRLGKANLTTRLVGRVTTSDEAATAAGRGETGAHLLPGKGAFLRVEGADVTRLQAYWLDDAGTESLIDAAVQRWGRNGYRAVTRAVTPEVEPVTFAVTEPGSTSYNRQTGAFLPVSVQKAAPRAVTGSAVTVTFPLPSNRPPSPAEASALRQLYEQVRSKNEVIRRAYGSKNGVILGYVNQALNEGGAA